MFTNPLKNLKALGLRENNIVADLGAGTGYYAIPAGHIVTGGKVYAVEIQRDFLRKIRDHVYEGELSNVECIWGNIEKIGGTKLKNELVDAAIASNVLFQVEQKENFIEEIKRILKKNGRVLLVDWAVSPVLHDRHIVQKEKARAMFEKKGFVMEKYIDAGEHHYGMILVKL